MNKNWKVLSLLVALATPFPALAAKPPTIPLVCGKVPNVQSEAERQYLDKASGGGDIYNVLVTYIGKKPTNKQLDAALRGCLAVAIKKDSSKDILATAWYRRKAGATPYDDDMLNPHGPGKYIVYSASSKKIEVRSPEKIK